MEADAQGMLYRGNRLGPPALTLERFGKQPMGVRRIETARHRRTHVPFDLRPPASMLRHGPQSKVCVAIAFIEREHV